MKKEKISEALQNIDEEYIEKAANYKKKKAFLPIVKWGGLAASLAIVVAGTALLMPYLEQGVTPPPITNEQTTPVTNEVSTEIALTGNVGGITETTTTTYWNSSTAATGEAGWREQYLARIQDDTYRNYAPMVAFQAYEVQLGNKLTDITVWGFWDHSQKDFFDAEDFTGDEQIETLRAEVYEIKGVSPEVAILVKYLDQGNALTTTHYYTFVNKDVENQLTSLGDFYEKFNAERYFAVKHETVLIESVKEAISKEGYYQLSTKNTEELRDLILSLEGRVVSDEELSDWSFTKQMTFDIDFNSTGAYSGYVGVFDNGYMIFNVRSTNYFSFAFDIGEENAEMLMTYIEENATLRHNAEFGGTVHMTTQTPIRETVETTYCEND